MRKELESLKEEHGEWIEQENLKKEIDKNLDLVDDCARKKRNESLEKQRESLKHKGVSEEEIERLGISPDSPRQPQGTSELVGNYEGGEDVRVNKGFEFLKKIAHSIKSFLFGHSLKPDNEKLILASQSEKALAQNLANNIKLNRYKNIEQVESLISGSFIEMVIIENEADEFIPIVGEKNYVNIPNMNLKGKRLSHNHVNNNPPSLEDMEVFIKQELKELRVVTTDGYLYIISNLSKKKLDFKVIKKIYNEFYEEAIKKAEKKFEKGLIKHEELEIETRHIQWQLTKKKEGFEYERKKFR